MCKVCDFCHRGHFFSLQERIITLNEIECETFRIQRREISENDSSYL